MPARREDHPEEEALPAPALPGRHSQLLGRRGLPGTSPEGSRESTPVGLNGRREPRCPPGVARPGRKPRAPACARLGFPRSSAPLPGRRGALSLASFRGEERAGCRRRLARVPARLSGTPAPAAVAPAPNGLTLPARSSGGSRAGCAQGALVSDPGEGDRGVRSAWKVHASAGAREAPNTFCRAPETQPGAAYRPILLILTDNWIESRGGGQGVAKDQRSTD